MLYALASAFSERIDRPVTLAELFAGEGPVVLADGAVIELAELRAALSGQPVDPPSNADALAAMAADMAEYTREVASWPPRLQVPGLSGKIRRMGDLMEADMRVIQSLGISRSRGIAEMAYLWGRSFVAERDRRAGGDANQQKRGRISRELKQELEAVLRGND